MVDLSETGVSRAERCDGVFSDKPRVYQKHVENCGNVGVLRQLNLLCDEVGKLQTLGSIACTDFSPKKVKESQKAKLWHSRDNERSGGRLARSYNQSPPPNDRRR